MPLNSFISRQTRKGDFMKKLRTVGVTIAMLVVTLAFLSCDLLTLFAAPHEHQWGSWTVTTSATCTTAGVETRVCLTDSSHIETRALAINPNAHNYGAWEVTITPTAITDGEETRTCIYNASHKETRPVSATGINVTGTWVYLPEPEIFLIFSSDMSVTQYEDGIATSSGNYTVSGNTITIIADGETYIGLINGNEMLINGMILTKDDNSGSSGDNSGSSGDNSGSSGDNSGSSFVAVTDIDVRPTIVAAGISIPLSTMVMPSNATNQTIIWTVKNAGTAGATITGTTLTTTAAGTAVITATIANGVAQGTPFSKDFTITSSGDGVPQFPILVYGVQAEALSSSSMRVTWNAADGAVSYKVYYIKGTDVSSPKILAGPATGTSYTLTGLAASTTYMCYVTGINSAGVEGGFSVSHSTRKTLWGGGSLTVTGYSQYTDRTIGIWVLTSNPSTFAEFDAEKYSSTVVTSGTLSTTDSRWDWKNLGVEEAPPDGTYTVVISTAGANFAQAEIYKFTNVTITGGSGTVPFNMVAGCIVGTNGRLK
jgi:hypothetical protein